jgi:hypothetical protein
MKHKISVVFALILIIVSLVYAQPQQEEDVAFQPPPAEAIEKKLPAGADLPGDAQGNAGPPITVDSASYYTDPNGVKWGTIDSAQLNPDGTIAEAARLGMPNGATGENVEGATSTGKDNYHIDRVGTLNQGLIVISDATNVQWNNGILTAGSAANMDYKGSTSTDIVMLVADGKEFSVESASAVQAGCFLVEEVNNAQFVVGRNVTMTTSGAGKVVYDQGQKVDYTAKQLNSSIVGSITACRRPTYQVKAMELNTRTGNFTELINGSGEIQLDGRYGVVCMNLTPVSAYDIDTGRYEDSFGFIIKEYAYKLCVQKAVAQKLVSDCPLCGLVDLANQKILLNGVIEYNRFWFDSALIDSNKRTAFKSSGFGKNIIDLAKGEVIISKDEPEIDTVLSNYLELREIKEGAATHRFLGINEKIGRVSKNWASIYSTSYSNSATTITNNILDYKREACHIIVLPPDSPLIPAIISSINEQKVRW